MKKRAIFILIFTLFAIQSYSQSFSNVDTINVVLSASSFKTVTLATGVKCITVDNSAQSLDLKIGFSPHGSTVDTSNTYTVPAGRTYSFPDRINNYLYLKSGAASTIRLIVDYGAGLPYYNQGSFSINSKVFQDTLTATTTSKTYAFNGQYQRVKLKAKYDSTSVKNDTLRIYNIGYQGDTTLVYVLDSVDNSVGYIVCAGDKQFREWRLKIYCPESLRILYSDSSIFTTKWVIITEAIKE